MSDRPITAIEQDIANSLPQPLGPFAQSLIPQKPKVCEWKQDDDGIYDTACGNKFFFDTGTAAENGFNFCPYCGARRL